MSESRTSKDMFDRRLYFTNISESDGGEYQCIAENVQGRTFHTYTVTVEGTHTHTRVHWLTEFIRSEYKVQNDYFYIILCLVFF